MEAKSFMHSLIRPEYQGKSTENHIVRLKYFRAKNQKQPKKPTNKKKLSRKEIKELGLYTLPPDTVKYADALKLHRVWRGYYQTIFPEMQPDVTDPEYDKVIASLLKADYHGAKIQIVRSKQSSVVGMKGIVVLDTKGTFKMVSKDDKLRTIPKRDSQFEVICGDRMVTIFGKHLSARPAERAVKKLKIFAIPDL
ncbi:ribonuclease P protein subunit p29-like [Anopheles stephensi]|uniref:ribonuclease P protein subunit p29-like n=1 Tax=Anopheles stephensi TaxID=30069 RepID=UPI00165897A7|nr:ribonuclease P protein subunit p29-like [Anopheles stephensi]